MVVKGNITDADPNLDKKGEGLLYALLEVQNYIRSHEHRS